MVSGEGESKKRLGFTCIGDSGTEDIPPGVFPVAGEAGVVPRRWERKMLVIDAIRLKPPVDAGVGVGAGAGVAAAGTGKIGSGDGVELWVGTAAGMD